MRTSYNSVSSARRLSSWLMVALGLAAYVGLIYGLTVLPLQFEVPLPPWGILVVPPVVYGLLVLLVVRRPSVVGWLVGTVVLSVLHTLLGLAREPLSALLDPALAGRPLPWLMPPPLPELVGVILLLVPLRDGLRARPRSARERTSGPGRLVTSPRGRAVVAPRPHPAASAESAGSLTETLLARSEPSSEPAQASPSMPPTPTVAPPASAPPAEPRRRRAPARAERGHAVEATRRARRSDVVLRIALDRIMGQLPPGTFLAPEDEVAASLGDPGHLLIPGELVVTQLSEGIARVAWTDIADQFPPHLVGLGGAEITEHLRDGLKLPLDEVVGQLPHELFVADTPEMEVPGLDRIPVPFHPLEGSGPAPSLLREAPPEIRPAPPSVERARVVPPHAVPAPAAPARPAPAPTSTPVVPQAVTPRVEPPVAPAPEPIRTPDPTPIIAAPAPGAGEPTVRISFGRVASEIPAEVFRVPLEQVAQQMRQPGSLLIPHSLILPQLAEGLIRVSWDAVAPQFPREQLTVSHTEMMERLPNGIELPLDEIIRQVPPDLFMTGGPAADVRGLESFPAPFQPLVSDPAPEPAHAPAAEAPIEAVEARPDPAPALVEVVEAASIAVPEVDAEVALARVDDVVEPEPAIESRPDLDERPGFAGSDSAAVAVVPEPVDEPRVTPLPNPRSNRVAEPDPARLDRAWQEMAAPAAPHAVPVPAGPAEMAEARRIAGLLAPIGSFEVSVQTLEGVTVFAMAAPTVAQETATAVAGLALPLLADHRAPWPVDQITLRGPETALVLTPLGGPNGRGPVLATGAPRGGALALLEILCRRAAGNRDRRPAPPTVEAFPLGRRSLVPFAVPAKAAELAPALTAFGPVAASVLRDAEGEDALYFFLPPAADASATGAFAQDLQDVMRKAAGSGAVFRTAVLRSGNTVLVIQNEEVGHGRSIIVVAGGEVTRPGLAYRQVERATTTLIQA
jgi:hypothetical protein